MHARSLIILRRIFCIMANFFSSSGSLRKYSSFANSSLECSVDRNSAAGMPGLYQFSSCSVTLIGRAMSFLVQYFLPVLNTGRTMRKLNVAPGSTNDGLTSMPKCTANLNGSPIMSSRYPRHTPFSSSNEVFPRASCITIMPYLAKSFSS